MWKMFHAVGSGVLLAQPEIHTRALECSVLQMPQEAGAQHMFTPTCCRQDGLTDGQDMSSGTGGLV